MTSTDTAQREFTLTWTLDAAPAEVFRAWTDPDHLDWYYNPDHPIPSEPIELDLRVGGVWRQYMVIDESTAYFTGGVYREIVPDEKLVFAWGASDGWPQLDMDHLDDSPLVTMTLSRSTAAPRWRFAWNCRQSSRTTACRGGGRWSAVVGATRWIASPPSSGAPRPTEVSLPYGSARSWRARRRRVTCASAGRRVARGDVLRATPGTGVGSPPRTPCRRRQARRPRSQRRPPASSTARPGSWRRARRPSPRARRARRRGRHPARSRTGRFRCRRS